MIHFRKHMISILYVGREYNIVNISNNDCRQSNTTFLGHHDLWNYFFSYCRLLIVCDLSSMVTQNKLLSQLFPSRWLLSVDMVLALYGKQILILNLSS